MADGQLTPPPDPNSNVPPEVAAGTDVKRTKLDKVGGFLGAISGGGALGSISDAIERSHQKRLATAKMFHDVMAEKLAHPAYADANDPDHQKTVDEYNAAKEQYFKTAGVDPETKKNIQMRTAIAEHHVGQQTQGRDGQPTPPPAPSSQLSGPPAANAPPQAAAAPSATPAAVPPPPVPKPAAAPAPDLTDIVAGTPAARQQREDQRAVLQAGAIHTAKNTADHAAEQSGFDQRMKQADTLNMTGDERQEFVATGKLSASLLNTLNDMDPAQRDALLQSSAPPDMTPDEKAVWNAGVAKAITSGKMDGITAATNSIYKERQTQGRSTANLEERIRQFKQTDDYRKWKENLDIQTKKDIAAMQQSKAPAAMMQTAEFASGGLKALDDATAAMQRLQARGVMGTLPANKVEDWIFKKGLVDPSLDAETRRDIGVLRSSMELAGSAMLRAHTGRTSKEIYDDFKGMLGVGQDWSALRGAMDESRGMLQGYADSATDTNIKKIRGMTPPPSAASSGGPRIIKYDKDGNRVQ